jgi:hypothetical protein
MIYDHIYGVDMNCIVRRFGMYAWEASEEIMIPCPCRTLVPNTIHYLHHVVVQNYRLTL